MVKDNLKIALRSFLKHPIYSAINVSGLVLGLSCSIIIFLWVIDELSFDRYHKDNDGVYKVMWNKNHADQRITTEQYTSGLLAERLQSEIPEIESITRATWSRKLFKFGETTIFESGCYADKTVFDVLNLKVIEGNILHALPDKNSVAISRRMASKYFQKQPALGKTFRVDNRWDATVTLVFEDTPENTTEKFEYILSFDLYIQENTPNPNEYKGDGWLRTIVKLRENTNKQFVDAKMEEIFRKEWKHLASPPPPPFLHSMFDWHLYNNFVNGKPSGGRINYIFNFSLVAILILLISCVNYMNLVTARSMKRAREIGIRKVVGASRKLLIRQFLIESTLLSSLSMAVALLIVHLILPVFNSVAETHVTIDYQNPLISGCLIGIAVATGLVAGSYPAFFLSAFRPASVLKGNVTTVLNRFSARNALVIFQFSISTVIIIAAMVVGDQIGYMRNKDVGYNRRHVLIVEPNEELSMRYDAFRNALLQTSFIESVSRADCEPAAIDGSAYYNWSGKLPDDNTYFNRAACDYDYLKTMGFKFVQGRNFSREFPSDSSAIVLTQEAANRMGTDNPIGEHLELAERKFTVVGVIADFNNLSLKENMHPTAFELEPKSKLGSELRIFVRYKTGSVTPSVEYIQTVYKTFSPDFPFEYSFLDQEFEYQLSTELTTYSLLAYFTATAIFISCLGLLGLASFSIEGRTKEIGIRKVMGATIKSLTVLLSKDFARLIMYSICIGCPIAYYLMQQYLVEYPYHAPMNLFTFLIPVVLMFVISLSIVSYQAIKAALGNPVESLRTE